MRKNPLFIALISVMLLQLSACATLPHVGVEGKKYTVTKVTTRMGENVDYGPFDLPQMDGESKESLIDRVLNQLPKSILEEASDALPGTKKARLEVTLDVFDIASNAGIIATQSGSILAGNVQLIDNKTNKVIAETHIRSHDRVSIGGNVGVLVGLAVNSVRAATQDRVEVISENFARDVKIWLESPIPAEAL